MPTKNLGRTKCQPQIKVRTKCQPLVGIITVGIVSGLHFVLPPFHEPLHLCIQGEEKAELDIDEIINRGLLNQYEVFPSELQCHKSKSIY